MSFINQQYVKGIGNMNKNEVIKRIIASLKKIENDDEVEIKFQSDVIEYQFSSLLGEYAILKNVIEIISKRPVEIGDDLHGFMD